MNDLEENTVQIVNLLGQLLNMAITGEMRSIIVITSNEDEFGEKTTTGSWAGMDHNNMAMLGELEVVKRNVLDLYVDLAVEPQTGELDPNLVEE